jgi:hypothetical protein
LAVLKYYDATTGQYLDLPGLPGLSGPAGEGVPAGGNAGDMLVKSTDDDFVTEWSPTGAGGDLSDIYGRLDQLENDVAGPGGLLARVQKLEDDEANLIPVLEQARDILIDHEARIAAIEGLGGVQIVFDSGISNGFAIVNEAVTIHLEDNTGAVIPWSNVGEVVWGDGTPPNQSQTHTYTVTRPFCFVSVVASGQVGVSQSFAVGLGLQVVTDVAAGFIYVGDTVTITVTNLRDGSDVGVGALTSVNWGEGASTPPSLSYTYTTGASSRSVTANSNAGAGSGTSPSFAVRSLVPTISSVVPADGLTPGGETVTINGSGFDAVTGVTMGGTPVTSFAIINHNVLEVVAPAHPAGTVTVVVESPYGNATRGNGYYFWNMPVYNNTVTPNSGPQTGQNVVTINGVNINGTRTITFGGINALQVTGLGTNTVEAVAPPSSPGTVDIGWTHGSGQSGTLPGAYTYI